MEKAQTTQRTENKLTTSLVFCSLRACLKRWFASVTRHAGCADTPDSAPGVPASAGVWPEPAEAGTPAAGPYPHDTPFSDSLLRYRSYAITPWETGFASGRAEDSRSFSQKCCSQSNIFVKKNKNVPRCRRRIGLSPGQTFGLNDHHVTCVTYAVQSGTD
jgi:hypothetical protein